MNYFFPHSVTSGLWKLITPVFKEFFFIIILFLCRVKTITWNLEFSSKSIFFKFRICLQYTIQNLLNCDSLWVDNSHIKKNSKLSL